MLLRRIRYHAWARVPPNCPPRSEQHEQYRKTRPAPLLVLVGARPIPCFSNILNERRPLAVVCAMLPAGGHKSFHPNGFIETDGARVSADDSLAQNATRQRFELFIFQSGEITGDYLRLLADGLQRDAPRVPAVIPRQTDPREASFRGDLPLQDKADRVQTSKKIGKQVTFLRSENDSTKVTLFGNPPLGGYGGITMGYIEAAIIRSINSLAVLSPSRPRLLPCYFHRERPVSSTHSDEQARCRQHPVSPCTFRH
jgi:hypothetical protein